MREALACIEGCEVVAECSNGKMVLEKIQELKPDVVTLDMEMPIMGGLDVLKASKGTHGVPEFIVISSHTERGGELTVKALEYGAFDFITKPDTGSIEGVKQVLFEKLRPRLHSIGIRHKLRDGYQHALTHSARVAEQPTRPATGIQQISGVRPLRLPRPGQAPKMIVIGISTGGPNALSQVIPALPADLGVPIFIVQHMPPIFTFSLADSLNKKSALEVMEATHGLHAAANMVYIAPGGKHMRIMATNSGNMQIHITDDAPENNCRPSVDYLFRSVSQHFPGKALAIVMTGMGNDGTTGVRLLKRAGCTCLIQDEDSCVVYGMPRSVHEAGLADATIPLSQMAETITRIIRNN